MVSEGAQSIIIQSVGAYKPERILTNKDLSATVNTSDEWITTRTGIKTRRIADEKEFTSHMGTQAARQALKRAKLSAEEIDLIIVATITPDTPFPATACAIQHQLGARPIAAFDLQAACSGFLYSLEVATHMMKSGPYRHALVIGSEKISSIINWEDRETCVLFGDGAGAVVLKKINQAQTGILGSVLGVDGSQTDILHQPAGGSAMPLTPQLLKEQAHTLKMNGREVFKVAVRLMEKVALQILEEHGMTIDEVTHIIPHQANIRIIESLANRLRAPIEKFITNLNEVGNTSAASIPLALNDAFESGKIQHGDTLLFIAFGAGLTWAATLVKWYSSWQTS